MHNHIILTTGWFAGSLALTGGFTASVSLAEEATPSGIVTSISRSAVLSTDGMPRGSEMWAIWISLPAGKKVEVKEPKVPSTWMDLEVGLTGSAVSATLSGKAPDCVLFGANGKRNLTAQETSTLPGEAAACNFSTGAPFWEENRGDHLYSRAQLNVGGPWVPGTYDMSDSYGTAGGTVQALRVNSISFREAEAELRAAGTMTATLRVVSMPPGSRSVTIDRYPTLRMVADGELRWGTIPVESEPSVMPQSVFKLSQFNWVEWTRPQQVVLSNESNKPAEIIEWSITP